MADRILVPYDGSVLSKRALEFALEEFPDADVTVIHVVGIPGGEFADGLAPELRPPLSERADAYATNLLDDARAIADEYGRSIETEVDRGRPEHRIVARTDDGPYDLLVVGSHGRERLSRAFLGTVAEKVIRRSPIPVVVVR